MLKVPRPGRVKTRLGRELGHVPAAWWFRHASAALLRRLRDPRWNLVLAVSPDRQGLSCRIWPTDLPRVGQGNGDLGDRMIRALQASPKGPVCVIGGDIPGVRPRHIATAFGALGGKDFVLGPALDGGFWLLGAKRGAMLRPGRLRGVRWSSEHALPDTLANLAPASAALTDPLQDVDTVQDLIALRKFARRNAIFGDDCAQGAW